MNKERWRVYNRRKQREYRAKWRKEHPLTKAQLKQEEIFKAVGHCTFCGMLLDSEYHNLHPLRGCLIAAQRIHEEKPISDGVN